VDWVAGRWYESHEEYPPGDPAERDGALQFSGSSSGVVHTDEAVVDTTQDFSVIAYVRPSSLTSSSTAVSQAGTNASGFGLGLVKGDAGCDNTAGCWEFWMPKNDTSSPPMTRARAALSPVVGEWVMIVGEFVGNRLRISTCHPTEEDPLTVQMGTWVERPYAPWSASGDIQVGSGLVQGGVVQKFSGTIDTVQIFDGGLTKAKITTVCGA
jgi:hypothetical protein